MTFLESVEQFVIDFKRPIEPSYDNYVLSYSLISEEFEEVQEEYDTYLLENLEIDRMALTAELADLIYVCCYAAVVLKLPLQEVFDEKHRANMTKKDDNGEPILREDGKIMKGPNYIPPNYERFFNV